MKISYVNLMILTILCLLTESVILPMKITPRRHNISTTLKVQPNSPMTSQKISNAFLLPKSTKTALNTMAIDKRTMRHVNHDLAGSVKTIPVNQDLEITIQNHAPEIAELLLKNDAEHEVDFLPSCKLICEPTIINVAEKIINLIKNDDELKFVDLSNIRLIDLPNDIRMHQLKLMGKSKILVISSPDEQLSTGTLDNWKAQKLAKIASDIDLSNANVNVTATGKIILKKIVPLEKIFPYTYRMGKNLHIIEKDHLRVDQIELLTSLKALEKILTLPLDDHGILQNLYWRTQMFLLLGLPEGTIKPN